MEENNKTGVSYDIKTCNLTIIPKGEITCKLVNGSENEIIITDSNSQRLIERCKENSGVQLVNTGVTKVKIEPLIEPLIYSITNSFTNPLQFAKTIKEKNEEKEMNTDKLKNKIKKVVYVDKDIKVKEPVLDSDGNPIEKDGNPVTKDKLYKGMVKVFWKDGKETVAYTSLSDRFNKETGFKTCVMKYVFGNRDSYDAVNFWTNKYVKYPSSCVEVSEALWKLGNILEKDKNRPDEQKGLPKAKFFKRENNSVILTYYLRNWNSGKMYYCDKDIKLINEFKKLARKYFPELRCREIYINDSKQNEIFVAIK